MLPKQLAATVLNFLIVSRTVLLRGKENAGGGPHARWSCQWIRQSPAARLKSESETDGDNYWSKPCARTLPLTNGSILEHLLRLCAFLQRSRSTTGSSLTEVKLCGVLKPEQKPKQRKPPPRNRLTPTFSENTENHPQLLNSPRQCSTATWNEANSHPWPFLYILFTKCIKILCTAPSLTRVEQIMHASLAFFVPTTMPGDFHFYVCFFLRKEGKKRWNGFTTK